INLEMQDGTARYMKIDVYKKLIWYSIKSDNHEFISSVSTNRVFEIIEMNKKGEKPEILKEETFETSIITDYNDVAGQESITRFDKKPKKRKKKRSNFRHHKKRPNNTNFKADNQKNKKNDR
ncbi:MAG: hypothetical protein J7K64_05580, partial [Bacteroidales bacterium]|nr:hypothetical protein [Bacteroidales bacterium]